MVIGAQGPGTPGRCWNHGGAVLQEREKRASPYTVRAAFIKRTRNNKCGEDVEKREPFCAVGRNVN